MQHNDMIVCRCEEVSLGQLIETMEKYDCLARELKLRTRAGMGYCGGRTCRCLVDRIVSSYQKKTAEGPITLGYQPPIRPVSFGLLGRVDHE